MSSQRPSNPSLPKRNRSLVTPPVKFRILKIHAAETRPGKRTPRWEAPDFPPQRPTHCVRGAKLGAFKRMRSGGGPVWASKGFWGCLALRAVSQDNSRMRSRALHRSSSRLHTTHEQPSEVVVRYPHHPFAGQRITVTRCVTHAGQAHYSIQAPDKHPALLPAWMTESFAATLPIVEVPRLPLEALRALCGLIEAQCLPPSSGMIRVDGGHSGPASTMATTRSSDARGGEPERSPQPSSSCRGHRPSERP